MGAGEGTGEAPALPSTKIICTIGPATASRESIARLLEAGMSIARINLSHGSREQHMLMVENIRDVRNKHGRYIAIAVDTRGPESRTVLRSPVRIEKGDRIRFAGRDAYDSLDPAECPTVGCDMQGLRSLRTDDILHLDDAKLRIRVASAAGASDTFIGVAQNAHVLESSKKITFARCVENRPCLHDADVSELASGLLDAVDMVFLSFTETARDVLAARSAAGIPAEIQVIAKIETQRGVDNVDEILEVADGVMAARGDLCGDVGVDGLFSRQKTLAARGRGRPVIMATEMMLSMVHSSTPSRAEISDVGNAVCDGCCGVMLSSETAVGAHPFLCTDTVRRICLDAEAHCLDSPHPSREEVLCLLGGEKDVVLTEVARGRFVLACADFRSARPLALLRGVDIVLLKRACAQAN